MNRRKALALIGAFAAAVEPFQAKSQSKTKVWRYGDLPVEQPTKFVLTINLRTAKALGIRIPDVILVRANRLIQ